MATILGYALFRGTYGEFTIPVIEVPNFTIPGSGRLLQLTTETYSAIKWNYSINIWNLVPNPPQNTSSNHQKLFPFECDASPSMEISVCLQQKSASSGEYYQRVDSWHGGSLAEWGAFIANSAGVPLIIKLPDEGNTYYLIFSLDEPPEELPEGVSVAFNITYKLRKFGFASVAIQSSPVILTPAKPKFYLSSPLEPIYVSRNQPINLEFSLKHPNGVVESNVPFTYPNSQPDATGITNWVIEGNTLTFTNECWYAISWIKFKSKDYPDLSCGVEFNIKDPKPAPNTPGPYLPEGGGTSGGGNGSTSSNTVTGAFDGQPGPSIIENLPNGSSGADIASSGMYTKYLCNNALLNLLAGFFWEDNVGIQALKAVLGNPIDSIISLTAYPFALDTLVPKTSTTIYFGQYDSHLSAFSLTKSSFQIDWGTVTIPFFWGSFLDYSPYTKIQLYLPWGVGFVSIDPNEVVPWSRKNTYNKADFVNGTIRVITNIELDKGACVHNIVGNNGRVIGSFGGVVGKQVPVTGSDNSARILAMINAAISSSAAIGTSAGGTLAAGKNLAYGKGMSMAERAEGREMIGNYKSYVGNTVQSLSNALSSPPSYPRAGTFSDATNTLGYQYPYLIISRPSQSVPQQYGRFMGYPSNIFHAHLGEVRGYTEVSSIHLDKIAATANELDELESILKGGVLL